MPFARLIVNPTAGANGTAKKWPHIQSLLRKIGLRFEHDTTEAPGHARELAALAIRQGYEMIVSVGGDGTINEVANGLHDSGDAADVLLGVISTGTGSDYVRTVGLAPSYYEACQRLISPGKLKVDVGVIEHEGAGETVRRLFVNFAGLGFDADIVRATSLSLKAFHPASAYLLGLLRTLVSYQNREMSFFLDGEPLSQKICSVLLCNGRYCGGGMLAAPHADPTDGFFDVLIIGDLSKRDLLWSLPRIYRGTHLTHPKVSLIRARQIEVGAARGLSMQADGELLAETPARCYILPGALNLAV